MRNELQLKIDNMSAGQRFCTVHAINVEQTEENRNTHEQTLSQCYVIHHKSHIYCPWLELSAEKLPVDNITDVD
jgi:hypothetical protein